MTLNKDIQPMPAPLEAVRPDGLATQVLSVVAGRLPAARRILHDAHVEALCEAVIRSEREMQLVVSQMIQAHRIAAETIVDVYIPAVSRRLGEDWCSDQRSFVEVTIGTSRLQALVRELSAGWRADTVGWRGAPTVALVVQQDEFHTLGAMVAATQFRRLGASVHLVLARSDCEVAELLDRRGFDMIALSVSGSERLESVRNLVKIIRMRVAPVPPIVVGGPMQDETAHHTKIHTGADHFSSDPAEALRLCGLTVPGSVGAIATTP